MDMPTLLSLYDQHLRVEIEYPGLRKDAVPGLVRFTRPAPGMNFVAYSRLEAAELDAAIQAQIDYFLPMAPQPFSWHVCEHDQPPDLRHRLVSHGFADDDDPDPILVLDLQEAPAWLTERVKPDVRRLERPEQIEDVISVEEQVLGGNFGWMRGRMGGDMQVPGYLRVYVAYVNDYPASAAWTYFHPGCPFARLFGGATLPAYRRRGLYSALVAVRAQEALARGCRYLTVGVSPMSRPILERTGFHFLTHLYALEYAQEDPPA